MRHSAGLDTVTTPSTVAVAAWRSTAMAPIEVPTNTMRWALAAASSTAADVEMLEVAQCAQPARFAVASPGVGDHDMAGFGDRVRNGDDGGIVLRGAEAVHQHDGRAGRARRLSTSDPQADPVAGLDPLLHDRLSVPAGCRVPPRGTGTHGRAA
jgi:hypothetical protein